MKPEAIAGGIVEAPHLAEGVIAVIIKTGVAGDLLSQLDEFIKNFFELFRFLQSAVGDQLPGFLAQRSIRLLQVAAHLHQCLFLALELDGERSTEFLVLLREPGFFGFQRYVLRAEKLDVYFRITIKDFVSRF